VEQRDPRRRGDFSFWPEAILMARYGNGTLERRDSRQRSCPNQSENCHMRILVVEDDKKIASFVIKGLKQSGFAVDHAAHGEDGLHLAVSTPYDAAVIDIMLPRLDGLSLVQELRNRKINLPVLFLSAKATVDDRIKGLQSGGDDYLVKPFAFSELLARVQALIRRATRETDPTTLTVGDLTMNLITRKVMRGERSIELQAREFSLLEYLMRNAGKVVSKALILEHVWDYSFDPQTNVVDVVVCRLRNKVDRDFECKMIHTLRGVGYVLKAN
jgi:heavy metal response regulator